MQLKSKRTLAAAAAGLALAVGGGVAYAQTQGGDEGDDPESALADVAARVGVTEEELKDAFRAEALERLDAAVAEGRLGEERAARIRERIESGERSFRGPHRGHHGPFFAGIRTAADYLGLEPEALLDELREGKTLAQVAGEQGKSVEGLEEALVAEARERIHRFVTEGPPVRPGMPDDSPPAA
jgi:hypothetical protein